MTYTLHLKIERKEEEEEEEEDEEEEEEDFKNLFLLPDS